MKNVLLKHKVKFDFPEQVMDEPSIRALSLLYPCFILRLS